MPRRKQKKPQFETIPEVKIENDMPKNEKGHKKDEGTEEYVWIANEWVVI